MYTLHIICPHCALHHAIGEWPREAEHPVLFHCQTKRGGCDGKAIVQPPSLSHLPQMQEVFVMAEPLTAEQAAHVEENYT